MPLRSRPHRLASRPEIVFTNRANLAHATRAHHLIEPHARSVGSSLDGRLRGAVDGAHARVRKPMFGTDFGGGAPDRIRTCDLRLRRATLYPAELRVHPAYAVLTRDFRDLEGLDALDVSL